MYKNKYGNFAEAKLTDSYVEMTVEEVEAFNKYGAEAFTIIDDECVLDPNYEQELAQKERQRLNLLSMTRGDMFEAIILAFGKTKADIRSMIENVEGLTDIERALYLNRFDEALDFYRGYPAVDLIGQMLGVSFEQLDKFFETNDYKYLTAVTLTINPTPADATVTINSEAKNTVTVPYGDTVEYSVAAEGYLTQSGTVEPTEDTTLEVELVAEVVEPEPPVEGTDEVENADTTDTED